MISINDIAKKHAITKVTVLRMIDAHPELGIERIERVRTDLTPQQASALSDLLVKSGHQDVQAVEIAEWRARKAQEKAAEAEDAAEYAELLKQVAEAEKTAAEAKAEAAVLREQLAHERAMREQSEQYARDEVERWRDELAEQRQAFAAATQQQQKLLGEAQAEAASYKPTLFGLYRRVRKEV